MNTDRIIVKHDSAGPLAYAADSLRSNSILAWRPDSDAEPFYMSIDAYHATKTASDKQAREVARKWENTWGNSTVLMQRLPRVVRETPTFKHVRKESEAKKEEPKLSIVPQAAKVEMSAGNRGYTALESNGLWKVYGPDNKLIAFATSDSDVAAILQDFSREKKAA